MLKLTPTGPLGTNMQKLSELVAASSAFQSRLRVESVREADQRIYWPWIEPELDPDRIPRPSAVIETHGLEWVKTSGGAQNHLYPGGALLLTLSDLDRYPKDSRNSLVDFLNFAEGVLSDLAEKSGTDDRICITSIKQQTPPTQNEPTDDQPRYWWARFEITWGADG